MANTGFKGIDVRQTGNELIFTAFLQTSAGGLLTSGTVTLIIEELQSDASIKSYDTTSNTFKSGALTTETLAMAYKKSNNATTDTGLWTAVLSTLTGFTIGGMYCVKVNCTGASPTDQMTKFQYGGADGDLAVTAGATGVAYLQSDDTLLATTVIPAPNVAGVPIVDLTYVKGTVSPAAAGAVRADAVTGAVGSVTGAVGSVTGNVGGSVASVVAAVTTTYQIKKNAARANFDFLMTDSTAHAPATGLTVTGTVSIDGGAFGATVNAVTELAYGMYLINLAAADLNGAVIILRFTATAADDRFITIVTQT